MDAAQKMRAILNKRCGEMLLQEATKRLQDEKTAFRDVDSILATAQRMNAVGTIEAMQQKKESILEKLKLLREEREGLYRCKFLKRS